MTLAKPRDLYACEALDESGKSHCITTWWIIPTSNLKAQFQRTENQPYVFLEDDEEIHHPITLTSGNSNQHR